MGSDGDGLPCQDSIGLTASQFARDLVNIHSSCVVAGVENGSDGDGLPCQDSIGLSVSLFVRNLVNTHQSGVATGVENVGKQTPSDPMETGCHVKSPLDSPQVCS